MINSGVKNVHTISSDRIKAMRHHLAPGGGMSGWTDTHEHAKMVAMHPQRMSQVDRCPNSAGTDEELLVGGSGWCGGLGGIGIDTAREPVCARDMI